MPAPAFHDIRTPTSVNSSLPSETIAERQLTALAILASHQYPDGTSPASQILPPVAGYSAWYDASQITGVADGAALTSWPDLSANLNNLTPGSFAAPTYYKTTAIHLVNGKPTVVFDGNTTGMVTGIPVTIQTMFIIAGPLTSSPTDTQAYAGAVSSGGWELRRDASTWHVSLLAENVANIASSVATILDGAPTAFVCCTYDGTTCQFFINSATLDSSTALTHSMTASAMGIGVAPAVLADYFFGPICEIILYPTVLSLPNIVATHTYLSTKWGTS
jgi:hypothetical protein